MFLSYLNNIIIFIKGILSFVIFVITSFYMTIIGIIPISTKNIRIKTFYTNQLKWYAKILTNTHFNINVKIINDANEKFEKPAIIVCNHQSLFDVPLTMGLFSHIFIVSNNWHHNSPIRYIIEKFAVFLPVTNGIEWVAEKAKLKFIYNYCGLYFPENFRTKNAKILRYHKGAFLLASMLHTDIIPVVIYASKEILEKNWYFFKHGVIKVYVGNRIKSVLNNNDEIKIQAKLVCDFSRKIYENLQIH